MGPAPGAVADRRPSSGRGRGQSLPLFTELLDHVVRELVRRGLEETRGNYKIVLGLFNMVPEDYKRFLGFLRKHECHVPFKGFRSLQPPKDAIAAR